MFCSVVLAATLFNASHGGVELTVSSDDAKVDPARSVFVDLNVVSSPGTEVVLPDLRSRVRGFSLAEDFAEEPYTREDGSKVSLVRWRLVPEPCAKEYKIAPFAVKTKSGASFVAGPVYFTPPDERAEVSGEMQIDPEKDMPPLSWRLVGWCALALAAAAALLAAFWFLVRYIARRVKEHRMSPVERAWAELERLMKKGLPGRGRFKDFYVELTMVVRRYVQRKHGVKAPHLTTEEFFEAARHVPSFPLSAMDGLMDFLQKADMVKFAGVKATPELADEATESARGYIAEDDALTKGASE